MRLSAYLTARGESQAAFGRRVGAILGREIVQSTIGSIARGEVIPRADLAHAIVKASAADPAPDGATVTMDDLIGRAA